MTQKFIDRDGLKVLWNQVNLKDYPNNETLMAVIDAIDETKANKDEIVQADWNQTDETALDYIKNRPFYEYIDAVVDNVTVNNGDTLDIKLDDNIGGEGSIVTVVWDGVSYEKTVSQCDVVSGRWSIPYYTIGNQSYLNDSENTFEDTGEEYLIKEGTSLTTISCDNNPHTLSIITQSLVEIDDKFLPNIWKGTGDGALVFNNNDNIASGSNSRAEGQYTTASGSNSHAEGRSTTASSANSHAEGYITKASGYGSHAEGGSTKASGDGSHAEGFETIASGEYQHVQGRFNVEDASSNYAHIVGNGALATGRSNAHTLDWDGNAEYAGDVIANGCGGEAPISLVEIAERVEILEGSKVAPEFNWQIGQIDSTTGAITADKQNMRIAVSLVEFNSKATITFPNTDTYQYCIYVYDLDGTLLEEESAYSSWQTNSTYEIAKDRKVSIKVKEINYTAWTDETIAAYAEAFQVTLEATSNSFLDKMDELDSKVATNESSIRKINTTLNNLDALQEKSPVTPARFFYNHLTNIPVDTFEEKAQWLARYDIFVYQAYLSNDLTMSRNLYDEELKIYKRALEINPDLKVFGYLTARGFSFDNDTNQKVGMTEYRTSPSNVDHPIFTKEELFAYMNLMAHCGGTKTSDVDEYGNPILTGGVPLYGVFFDDYGFNFGSENTSLINQGDWESVREKQNALIDYAHSVGLSVMVNSSPDDIFSYTATTSCFNPNGEYSHMNENDWVCLESYFLRSDNTYALNNDNHAVTYREQYKDIYKSKLLALTYLSAVDESDVESKQIASTFATYQALCQGIDSISLHGTSMYMEIPSDFSKYYSFDDSAVYTANVENGTYSVSVNGHTVTTTRNISKTAYGQIPNANTLSSCKVTIDGSHTFNNGYLRSEEVLYELNEFENEINKKISEISTDFAESSNLYHRAFIDDWDNTYSLSDYTNYATTFKNAFGGEDSGTTSIWNSEYPYDVTIRLPQAWSWRRVLMDVSDLKGKTVEIGFDSCDVYAEDDSTQHPVLTWQVIGNCESNSWTEITTFKTDAVSTSVDGVDRCCTKFTVPEDIKELIFWCQRTSSSPSVAWIVDAKGLYLIDPSEHTVTKTWFTNYAPHSSNWGVNGSSYTMERIENGVKVHYNSLTTSYETCMSFPKNDSIFKAGETWELGVKDLKMIRDDGVDVTDKIYFSFNLGTDIGINAWGTSISYSDYKNRKSDTGDDNLISLVKFTIPEAYAGGMPETPLYLYPSGYAGGDANGFYTLTVEGLYLYKIDERDELFVRGEDPSETLIKLNRINEYNPDEKLQADSLYIVGNGSMFATNRRKEKIDICGTPTFDLTSMGLPVIQMDGSEVSVETDTTALIEALEKGSVKLKASANYGGNIVPCAIIGSAFHMIATGSYSVSSIIPNVDYIVFVHLIITNHDIVARCNVLSVSTT